MRIVFFCSLALIPTDIKPAAKIANAQNATRTLRDPIHKSSCLEVLLGLSAKNTSTGSIRLSYYDVNQMILKIRTIKTTKRKK